jgi:cysteine desulfurase
MEERIYLDHAATTPLLPEVAAAMQPWLESKFGNASSLYAEGREARQAVDSARETVAGALGCEFGEVIFTSSGTEAANLAIIGSALGNEDSSRNRILFSAAEHHCVLHSRLLLKKLGYKVEFVRVDRSARMDLDRLGQMLGPDVLLVCAMSINNELGTLNEVDAISRLSQQHGALHFCDRVQKLERVGKEDLACLSAHKLNGPKGAGALFVRAGTRMKPVIAGGGQERELRAGTEDVAAIVGFAEAVRQHQERKGEFEAAKSAAKSAFVTRLQGMYIPGLIFTVDPSDTGGHVHLRIQGKSAETMLIKLDRAGISASSGAACSSGSIEPSHVLLAAGYSEAESREGLRFSFGVTSTIEEGVGSAELIQAAAKQG